MSYYLYLNNQTAGPYPIAQITQMLASKQITVETPCCREGDTGWSTVANFIQSTSTASLAAASSAIGRFSYPTYLIRRKVLKILGGAFHIFGPDNQLLFYSEMKAFKLREDIRLYTGEDKQTEALTIQARQILDISATYDVVDAPSKAKIGALRRKGLKSILKDEWVIMDSNDQEIGFVKEDSLVLALVRRFLTGGWLPQKYIGEVQGTSVCTFKQNFNPFVMKISLDFSKDTSGLLDRRLGIAAAILLCAIEGRQN